MTLGDLTWPLTGSLHKTCTWVIVNGQRGLDHERITPIWCVSLEMGRISIFSHWLIMTSSMWADLIPPISRIWDRYTSFRYSCTYRTQKVWNWSEEFVGFRTTSNFSNKTREVGSRDLFWWPDLTWPEIFVFAKMCEMNVVTKSESFSLMALGVWRWDRKNLKGASEAPPPRQE